LVEQLQQAISSKEFSARAIAREAGVNHRTVLSITKTPCTTRHDKLEAVEAAIKRLRENESKK